MITVNNIIPFYQPYITLNHHRSATVFLQGLFCARSITTRCLSPMKSSVQKDPTGLQRQARADFLELSLPSIFLNLVYTHGFRL